MTVNSATHSWINGRFAAFLPGIPELYDYKFADGGYEAVNHWKSATSGITFMSRDLDILRDKLYDYFGRYVKVGVQFSDETEDEYSKYNVSRKVGIRMFADIGHERVTVFTAEIITASDTSCYTWAANRES